MILLIPLSGSVPFAMADGGRTHGPTVLGPLLQCSTCFQASGVAEEPVTMHSFQKRASDQSQKCRSTLGSYALG
jgi:hypothetical protein